MTKNKGSKPIPALREFVVNEPDQRDSTELKLTVSLLLSAKNQLNGIITHSAMHGLMEVTHEVNATFLLLGSLPNVGEAIGFSFL